MLGKLEHRGRLSYRLKFISEEDVKIKLEIQDCRKNVSCVTHLIQILL